LQHRIRCRALASISCPACTCRTKDQESSSFIKEPDRGNHTLGTMPKATHSPSNKRCTTPGCWHSILVSCLWFGSLFLLLLSPCCAARSLPHWLPSTFNIDVTCRVWRDGIAWCWFYHTAQLICSHSSHIPHHTHHTTRTHQTEPNRTGPNQTKPNRTEPDHPSLLWLVSLFFLFFPSDSPVLLVSPDCLRLIS